MSGAVSASTLATASVGISAFGAASSTVAAYNKSKQDKAAYNYQAQVEANNAQYSEWGAQDAIMQGQKKEQNVRQQTAQLKGTQRSTMAARGVALDEGSPLDILTTTDYMGEVDALAVRDNANRDAWALRESAKGNSGNAALLRARADSESPLLAATGTLLTGAGNVASNWYRYTNKRT